MLKTTSQLSVSISGNGWGLSTMQAAVLLIAPQSQSTIVHFRSERGLCASEDVKALFEFFYFIK